MTGKYGTNGPDTIVGGSGDDWLYGFGDNDILQGGLGADYLNGGDGVDAAWYVDSPQGSSSTWRGQKAMGMAAPRRAIRSSASRTCAARTLPAFTPAKSGH
jgi:serralysin